MITGTKKAIDEKVTIEKVLEKVTEYDIFRFYMSHDKWKLNVVTYSPFRNEQHPSFLISNRYGSLSFIDFADTSKRGDCFEFVKIMHNLSNMYEVLSLIDRDFGLAICSKVNINKYKRIVTEYTQPILEKKYSFIQVVTRKFTNKELEYWNNYYQDVTDLKANNVYAIKKVFLNKQIFPLGDNEFTFGYHYDGHWKIYRPFKDKKVKWLSNVPLNKSWGIENLEKDKNSLICKSLKDYMVCRKVYKNVCGVQNESLGAFSQETIEDIKNNSNIIFYGGDSDKPGKEASHLITKTFNFKHINPPDYLLPSVKDFADWAKEKNLEELYEHFIKKGLYG